MKPRSSISFSWLCSSPSSPVTSSRSRGLSRLLRVTPLRDSFPQQNRAMWPKRPQLKHRIVFWRPRSGAIDVGLRENSFLPTSLSEADDDGNSSCLINSDSHSAAARAALTAVWSVSAWACFTARRNSTLSPSVNRLAFVNSSTPDEEIHRLLNSAM